MKKLWLLVMLLCVGCQATGKLGIAMRNTIDPGQYLKNPTQYKELGAVEGTSCRGIFLLYSGGEGTFSDAMDDALAAINGDGLINIEVTNSLVRFPVLFISACTTVKGTAIKLIR
jgi:hypothetical protein